MFEIEIEKYELSLYFYFIVNYTMVDHLKCNMKRRRNTLRARS